MRLLPLFLLLTTTGLCAAESAADAAISRAIAVLQSELDRTTVESEKTKLQAAVEGLKANQGEGPARTVEADHPLTKKDYQLIIGAPFQLKGDIVTIAYSWSSPKEMSDWDVAGPPPELKGAALLISPGSTLTHKLRFAGKFDIHGEIALGNREGKHLGSTGGFSVEPNNYNGWFVNLLYNGTRYGSDAFDKDYNGASDPNRYLPFSFALNNGVVAFTWEKVKLGHAHADPFGGLVLGGGNGGDKFRNIVISGVLDPEWVKAAISKASAKH